MKKRTSHENGINRTQPKKLSVIIPAWNEGAVIFHNLRKIGNNLDETFVNSNYDYEIIVVNDGSKDKTFSEAMKAANYNRKIKVVDYRDNGGKGFAIKYGFKFCSGEIISFLDADLDLHPKFIAIFVKYMNKTNADIVMGSKRHPLSKIQYPIYRKILSSLYHNFVRLLFNLRFRDTQTGLKLFKIEVLEHILPIVLCKKYAFDLELIVNAHYQKYSIVEAPIELNWQRSENRIKLRDIWYTLLDTLGIFYRLKIIKYYYGKIYKWRKPTTVIFSKKTVDT